MSSYYFSKLFKEVSGYNFIEYVTNMRIELAKELLMDGSLSMKEICVDVGYGDPNYFSRIFKKCVGVTPTEFREGKQIEKIWQETNSNDSNNTFAVLHWGMCSRYYTDITGPERGGPADPDRDDI